MKVTEIMQEMAIISLRNFYKNLERMAFNANLGNAEQVSNSVQLKKLKDFEYMPYN